MTRATKTPAAEPNTLVAVSCDASFAATSAALCARAKCLVSAARVAPAATPHTARARLPRTPSRGTRLARSARRASAPAAPAPCRRRSRSPRTDATAWRRVSAPPRGGEEHGAQRADDVAEHELRRRRRRRHRGDGVGADADALQERARRAARRAHAASRGPARCPRTGTRGNPGDTVPGNPAGRNARFTKRAMAFAPNRETKPPRARFGRKSTR